MVRNFGLQLTSIICPNGVELVHRQTYPDIAYARYGRSGPDWFVGRSGRIERRLVRDAIGLEDALIVRFVNATTDSKRMDFLSAFGMPLGLVRITGLGIAESRNVVLGQQKVLRRLLQEAGSGDVARATRAANEALKFAGPDQRSLEPDGRMVWTKTEPLGFMYMEIAFAAQNGARLGTCRRCGAVFLYGHTTGRRETAKYCGAACRVGAHRANQLNKGD